MNETQVKQYLALIKTFSEGKKEILATGLCGSWARGTAHPDSDLDISFIVTDPAHFRNQDWLEDLEFSKINEEIDQFEDKTYGVVWSRHVFLRSGSEIELSFAGLSWADTKNLDKGTRKVVTDGFKILYDPNGILKKLLIKVNESN